MGKKRLSVVFQCRWCGMDFHPLRLAAQFCSRSCRSKSLFRERPELREQSRQNMKRLIARPDVQKKLSEHLRGPGNPFKDPLVRARAEASLRERGYSMLNGGNGKGMSVPQRMLQQRLGWPAEYVVATQAQRGDGYPTHYKIDLAHPTLMIAVEVDGVSHSTPAGRSRDEKKDRLLTSQGWSVLRFTNSRVREEFEQVVAEIMAAVRSST